MKTTFLTASVLIALSLSAHSAETPAGPVFTEPRAADQAAQAAADKAKADAAEKARKEAAAAEAEKAKAAAAAKSQPVTAASPAPAPAAAPAATAKKQEVKHEKYTGFIDNNGVVGDLEVGIVGADKPEDEVVYLKFKPSDCTSGSCGRVVPFDRKTMGDINNMKDLRDALGKKADADETLTAAEKRRKDRKKEKDETEITEKDIRSEIVSMLEVECGIDEDSVKNRKNNRDSREIRLDNNLQSALGRTRFSGLEIPVKGLDSNSSDSYRSDAECSASVLKEFMEEHEAEDVSDLKDKLKDLKDEELKLKKALRLNPTKREEAAIEKKLASVKAEIEKTNDSLTKAKKVASAYDRVLTNIAKQLVIKPSVNDLATRKFFTSEDFFLHDLAATTSDNFKGVRKAASQSLLDIYRLQSQSYLAFSEMANRTNDPQQKLQFQETALHYQQAGINYNAMMNSGRFRGELAHSANQAGLDPKSILEEIYGTYSQGSQEITSYLTRFGANGNRAGTNNQALPQILMVNSDGTYSPVTVNSNGQVATVGGANGRGGRVLPQSLLNGTGSVTQSNSTIQLARPVPNAPDGNLTVQNQNGFVNNQQPLIQQQQPNILTNGVRVRGRQ